MQIYVVEAGDTLTSIAERFNVSPARIISDNGLSVMQNLAVGQALIILIPQTVYVVVPGDTIATVASKNGISEIELIQNNPYLADSENLIVGETLVISFEGEKRRAAYFNSYAYPFINRSVLLRALPFLTYLSVFSYGFTETGELIVPNDSELIAAAYRFNTAPVLVLSSITESGGFSSARASQLFNDSALQERVLDSLLAVMQEKGYVGLDIDFEYILATDRNAFTAFVQNAANKLSPYGYFVNTDLAPKVSDTQEGRLYEGHNYAALGAASDTLLLMTYEWGYTFGPPLAVAPINRVREVVNYGVSVINPQKLYLGIPNYGYDWALPFVEGLSRAYSLGNQQAVALAARYNAEIRFDEVAMSPYFEYTSPDGIAHIVWFEDVRSILAKFDLMDEYGLRGAGYWNAMRPFAQNYALLGSLYDIVKVV